ncbi:MAG: PocR ligand-binding domain-containing protein [Clostridia bacterium]|nr:PocR ligand-binding domain-containing protein [Clostridia bacterium]
MIVKYDTEQLIRIIKNIFDITGISISVLDTEYNTLARCSKEIDYCSLLQDIEAERMHCNECDRKILKKCRFSKRLEKHICHAGLYDAAMPIVKCDTIVGFAIMGRVRSANSPVSLSHYPDTDAKTIKKLETLYDQLPFITENRLMALYDLLSYIIFDNAIQIVYDPLVTEIVDFIDTNFHENLSVGYLCSRFHISKNSLYKAFNDNFRCTVNEYITERRLKYAKTLLAQSDEPVYQIARNSGIDNYTYFCRLFKIKNGVTPTEYRKKYKN